jgi:hypothetical protein
MSGYQEHFSIKGFVILFLGRFNYDCKRRKSKAGSVFGSTRDTAIPHIIFINSNQSILIEKDNTLLII